jgi:hypothetical protein
MKKLSIIIFLIGLVGLFSCKKDETKAVIQSPSAPVLNVAGGDTIALKKTNADTLITYTWSAASFGLTLVTTYTIQMDKQGNNFKDPLAVGTVTSATSFSLLTSALNNKLLGMEFNPDLNPSSPLALEFRVMASVSPNANPAYSPVVSKVMVPYYVKIVYPFLFVPGAYNGWNAGDSITVIYSAKSNNIYDGYIFFDSIGTGTNAGYKYSMDPKWTTNYGDNGADGTLELNGANIIPVGAGYYHLTADLNTLTHTYLRTTWSVIGDATPGGWNTDTDMAYDPIARTWKVTLDLTAANIKFRANHAWDLNYGDTGADGSLDMNGDNIAVPVAGNYTVTLNLSGAIFRYNLKKN